MLEFGTAGIRGNVRDAVRPETALAVGRAVAAEGSEVAIARDGRATGATLLDAAVAGVTSGGTNVERLGMLPTPTLAFATRGRLGIMLTASHNPPSDNGIKVFRDGVEFDRDAERRIERRLKAGTDPARWDAWGTRRRGAILDDYREAVVDYLQRWGDAPSELTIAVDCGNGCAGMAVPWVLGELGADVRTINAHIDGHFSARGSEPTPEALGTLRNFVADGTFDLGLALDGDADRLVVVDGAGDIVHEDTVLAILAHEYVDAAECEEPAVVTTPNASTRVDHRVKAAGGRVERTALGTLHEGIARVRSEDPASDTRVVFAAEPWKHIHPAFGGWIDGIVSAGLVSRLVAVAGGLDPLREPVPSAPYRKRSVGCPADHQEAVMDSLERALRGEFPDADLDTAHGIRLSWESDGWILIRPSGTEPKIRIYAEHPRVDEVVELVIEHVRELVESRG